MKHMGSRTKTSNKNSLLMLQLCGCRGLAGFHRGALVDYHFAGLKGQEFFRRHFGVWHCFTEKNIKKQNKDKKQHKNIKKTFTEKKHFTEKKLRQTQLYIFFGRFFCKVFFVLFLYVFCLFFCFFVMSEGFRGLQEAFWSVFETTCRAFGSHGQDNKI